MANNIPISSNPLVTIVVVSHARRNYLISAIRSALNQTADRDSYEIIAVKDYSDHEIDTFLRSNGVTIVDTVYGPIGAYMKLGVENAKGEVIAFLDDDDIFVPTKVQTLFGEFLSDPQLIYFHNSYMTIDSNGDRLVKGHLSLIPQTTLVRHEDKSFLLSAVSRYAAFNSSCIAVRRRSLSSEFLQVMEKQSRIPDFLLYWHAINANGNILVSDKVLTKYRFHQSASHEVLEFETWTSHYSSVQS